MRVGERRKVGGFGGRRDGKGYGVKSIGSAFEWERLILSDCPLAVDYRSEGWCWILCVPSGVNLVGGGGVGGEFMDYCFASELAVWLPIPQRRDAHIVGDIAGLLGHRKQLGSLRVIQSKDSRKMFNIGRNSWPV